VRVEHAVVGEQIDLAPDDQASPARYVASRLPPGDRLRLRPCSC
jgi:hypothetical protein